MSFTHRHIPTVGIGHPVGSGNTSLDNELLSRLINRELTLDVIANDVLTNEDTDALRERFAEVVPEDMDVGVETGTCPHTGIREDSMTNLVQIDDFFADYQNLDLAPDVGTNRDIMEEDTAKARDDLFVTTNCKTGDGVGDVLNHVNDGVLFT